MDTGDVIAVLTVWSAGPAGWLIGGAWANALRREREESQ